MSNLGVLLNDQDPDAARDWYQRAAAAGHPDATEDLHKMTE